MRGRKPIPTPGTLAATALAALPRCPDHLNALARKEWRRLATPLFDAGILTLADRAALAAYCVAYARWVEAERKLAETPTLLKAPSGYVQQSPWLTVANKQMELMGRYMSELGLTPVARTRVDRGGVAEGPQQFTVVWQEAQSTDGTRDRVTSQSERDIDL
jgi:P27 family predicted phage terminase small subunit